MNRCQIIDALNWYIQQHSPQVCRDRLRDDVLCDRAPGHPGPHACDGTINDPVAGVRSYLTVWENPTQ